MVNTDRHHLNTGFTLHLASELVRPCEIYFQPYMAGNDQMSLPDIVALVLRNYTPEMRRVLLGNVRLVGGGCAVPGIRERLLKELTALAEVGTQIHIEVAREPRLGCFYGMRGLVNKYPEYVKQNSIRRIDFLHGNIGTKEHLFGRLHF
jgi:actin-related protein